MRWLSTSILYVVVDVVRGGQQFSRVGERSQFCRLGPSTPRFAKTDIAYVYTFCLRGGTSRSPGRNNTTMMIDELQTRRTACVSREPEACRSPHEERRRCLLTTLYSSTAARYMDWYTTTVMVQRSIIVNMYSTRYAK